MIDPYDIGSEVSDGYLYIGEGLAVHYKTGEIGETITLSTDPSRYVPPAVVLDRPANGDENNSAWEAWAERVRAAIQSH